MSLKSTRPWGTFEILCNEPTYKCKRLIINSQQSISLQRHQYRAEHWYVVQGSGIVTLGEKGYKDSLNLAKSSIQYNSSVDIPIGRIHRVKCISEIPLIIIEVQTGSYFGEDDIERFEDEYGRDVKDIDN